MITGKNNSIPDYRYFSPHARESKTVFDSGFRISVTRFQNFVSGTWIPDSNL